MFKHCPGLNTLIRPNILIEMCPVCGEEIEFFEYETETECPNCGTRVKRESGESCLVWCSYAEKCIEHLESSGVISKDRAEELRRQIKEK